MIKQEAIRKINSMGKVGVILSRILKILMIVVTVLVLTAAIIFTILPKDFLTMEVEGICVKVNMQGNFIHFSSRELRIAMWLMVFYLIMGIVVASFAEKLCKAFQTCETPFAGDVIRWMRNTAYSLIPFAVLSSVTDTFSSGITSGASSFSLTVNMSMILVLLALTYVFRYGAVLQQEADETL